MAARLRKMHQDDVRAKIQASQLVNRLTDHVLNDKALSATQVTTALGLLKKVLPDLSSVELKGDEDRPVVHRIELVGVSGS